MWPLVGRNAELQVADETCAEGRGVVLVGAVGVGKTRLALELLRELEHDGYPTVWLVASRSAASIPLGAFGPLVPPSPSVDVLTVNSVADDVKRRFPDQRLALFVDDAHLLDEASAALLHRLVLEGIALAVVTIRGRPTADAVVALWKDGHCERFEVLALSFEEVRELVGAVLGGAVDEAVPQRLWRVSRGNPLFLRELVGAALDAGTLAERRGTWVWTGPMRLAPALADLVRARLDELDADMLDVLALLAIVEPLALEMFVALRGTDVVDRLAREQLIELTPHARTARLAHPLFGETVLADAGAPTLSRLSRELAHAHSRSLQEPAAELRRVVWHLDGGVPVDSDLLLRASRYAQQHKLSLATRLARAAVETGGGVTAYLRLADLLANAGRVEEANEVLAEIDNESLDDRARIRIASLRATTLLWFLSRPGDALRVIEQAERTLSDRSLASELAATRLQAAMQEGLVDEVSRLAARVLDDEGASFEVKAGAIIAGVPSWLLAGDLLTAIKRCEQGVGIAGGSANAFPVRDLLHFGAAAAQLYLGRVEAAERTFEHRRRLAAASESDVQLRFLHSQGLARAAMVRGSAPAAVRYLREAVVMVEKSPELIAWNLGLLAQALALAGDVDGARRTLDEALATAPRGLLAPDQGRAAALIAEALGERSRAIEQALATADRALDQGQRLPALFCSHDAARWGAGTKALRRLRAAAR